MTPADAPSDNAIDSPHNNEDHGEEMDRADGGDPLLDDHLDDASALPASKDKGDLFHQFQSFPMKKSDPSCTLHATFDMDPTDFLQVAARLAKKKALCDEDALPDHFCCNREWWRRRVKMSVPDRETHARAARNLHEFVKKLMSSCDAKVADYFDAFERETKEGLFDELSDLQMCEEDGQDSNGLNLYLSRRGSNRAELCHRFLMLAIGPTVCGPELAHYLMVLVTTRFNVNTGW